MHGPVCALRVQACGLGAQFFPDARLRTINTQSGHLWAIPHGLLVTHSTMLMGLGNQKVRTFWKKQMAHPATDAQC